MGHRARVAVPHLQKGSDVMPRFETDTNWFGWNAPERSVMSAKRRILLLTMVNLMLSILCGLVPTGVTRDKWVSFAATAALVALMLEIIGAVKFYITKNQISRREFQTLYVMLRWASGIHMALTLVAVIAAVVSCVRSWTGIADLLVTAGLLLTGLCSFLVRQNYIALPAFEMEDPS